MKNKRRKVDYYFFFYFTKNVIKTSNGIYVHSHNNIDQPLLFPQQSYLIFGLGKILTECKHQHLSLTCH